MEIKVDETLKKWQAYYLRDYKKKDVKGKVWLRKQEKYTLWDIRIPIQIPFVQQLPMQI